MQGGRPRLGRRAEPEKTLNYYLLMFLESYANNGRSGFYWWPGVDQDTRRAATAPEETKEYIRFIEANRWYYEGSLALDRESRSSRPGPAGSLA